jgi:hypothetical protein
MTQEAASLSAGMQVMLEAFVAARERLTNWQQTPLLQKQWSSLSDCQHFLFHSYLEQALALQNSFVAFSQIAGEATERHDAQLQQKSIQFEFALTQFLSACRTVSETVRLNLSKLIHS